MSDDIARNHLSLIEVVLGVKINRDCHNTQIREGLHNSGSAECCSFHRGLCVSGKTVFDFMQAVVLGTELESCKNSALLIKPSFQPTETVFKNIYENVQYFTRIFTKICPRTFIF